MIDTEPDSNALGTIQSLFDFRIIVNGKQISRTLKFQSSTRWPCKYKAEKNMIGQLYHNVIETNKVILDIMAEVVCFVLLNMSFLTLFVSILV